MVLCSIIYIHVHPHVYMVLCSIIYIHVHPHVYMVICSIVHSHVHPHGYMAICSIMHIHVHVYMVICRVHPHVYMVICSIMHIHVHVYMVMCRVHPHVYMVICSIMHIHVHVYMVICRGHPHVYMIICLTISKSPTFSLRTQILPLAAIRLAAHRKYTVRQIRQKTPVAPLCEWKNLRAERLNCTELYLLIFTFEKNGTMTRGSSKPLNIFHVLYIGDRSDQNVVFVCPDSRLLRRNTRTSRRKNTTWNRYWRQRWIRLRCAS